MFTFWTCVACGKPRNAWVPDVNGAALWHRRAETRHDVSVFFIPQRSVLCERLLKAEGVYGDVVIGDIPVDWVPYDTDVLSLELESAFRVR